MPGHVDIIYVLLAVLTPELPEKKICPNVIIKVKKKINKNKLATTSHFIYNVENIRYFNTFIGARIHHSQVRFQTSIIESSTKSLPEHFNIVLHPKIKI